MLPKLTVHHNVTMLFIMSIYLYLEYIFINVSFFTCGDIEVILVLTF